MRSFLQDSDLLWPCQSLPSPESNVGGTSLVFGGGGTLATITTQAGRLCTQVHGNTSGDNGLVALPTNTSTLPQGAGDFLLALSIKISLYWIDLGNGGYTSFVRRLQTKVGESTTAVGDSIQLNGNNTNNGQWYMGLATSGTVANYVNSGADHVTANTWTCLGFSWDGTNVRLYRDGALKVGPTSLNPGTPIDYHSDGPWHIGGHPTGGNLNGYMQNASVSRDVQPASWFVLS